MARGGGRRFTGAEGEERWVHDLQVVTSCDLVVISCDLQVVTSCDLVVISCDLQVETSCDLVVISCDLQVETSPGKTKKRRVQVVTP